MPNPRFDPKKIRVILVPADQLGVPKAPDDRLTLAERRARFIGILARLYREMQRDEEPRKESA